MSKPQVVLTDLVMGESVRWHDGHVWLSDWVPGEIIRVDGDKATVVTQLTGMPLCFDWTPRGVQLVLVGSEARLLRGGALFADLRKINDAHPWNDITTDSRGNTFINNIGYDFPGGAEPGPGLIAVVTPDGSARQVAGDVLFPNGMAVTADDSTLIVAESHGARLTAFDIADDGSLSNQRVWADLPGGAPDGICLDAQGAVWYADVPNEHCVRVREGGEVLDRIPLDRGAFDCVISADQSTLYAATADFSDPQAMFTGRTGQLVAIPLD
ncbi:SMP-30/gluconolactonase/LRE family protein [Actinoplanes sp. TBRC 11911]|uniref:SMP-30/gluconolactonase/LRE family protein n=1 Tax=Actinoplanes sp. TBRC 11911 TaxID=2729386 RepID=UPI00145F1F0C|nr:SMP-30/gluconolactonase/LRE family protein [Actinoplanes sp. TBRC 11911]NMO52114.1 SMP-30/gluconolactonase/LRE family protein [Actinoplanes sp. TBRC 11911]